MRRIPLLLTFFTHLSSPKDKKVQRKRTKETVKRLSDSNVELGNKFKERVIQDISYNNNETQDNQEIQEFIQELEEKAMDKNHIIYFTNLIQECNNDRIFSNMKVSFEVRIPVIHLYKHFDKVNDINMMKNTHITIHYEVPWSKLTSYIYSKHLLSHYKIPQNILLNYNVKSINTVSRALYSIYVDEVLDIILEKYIDMRPVKYHTNIDYISSKIVDRKLRINSYIDYYINESYGEKCNDGFNENYTFTMSSSSEEMAQGFIRKLDGIREENKFSIIDVAELQNIVEKARIQYNMNHDTDFEISLNVKESSDKDYQIAKNKFHYSNQMCNWFISPVSKNTFKLYLYLPKSEKSMEINSGSRVRLRESIKSEIADTAMLYTNVKILSKDDGISQGIIPLKHIKMQFRS